MRPISSRSAAIGTRSWMLSVGMAAAFLSIVFQLIRLPSPPPPLGLSSPCSCMPSSVGALMVVSAEAVLSWNAARRAVIILSRRTPRLWTRILAQTSPDILKMMRKQRVVTRSALKGSTICGGPWGMSSGLKPLK
jgi:hypothetical protein